MPRRQKKYHYIYKTTCQVTGKFYVGMHSTDDLDDGYLGSGKILGYSIGKHSRENHKKEILEYLPSREALKLREKEIVNEELLAHPLNINLKYGGEGGETHIPKRQFHSAGGKVSGKKHKVNLKKAFDDPLRKAALFEKMVRTRQQSNGFATFTGKTHSSESKKQMSSSQRGSKNSQFGTCWVTNGVALKIKSEELDFYLTKGYKRGRKFIAE